MRTLRTLPFTSLAVAAALASTVAPGGALADAPPPAPPVVVEVVDARTPDLAPPVGDAELVPGRAVLLLAPPAVRGPLEEALLLELAPRGVAVLGLAAPSGDTALERAADAQRQARVAGAVAAVWVETAATGGGATLRVVPADAEAPRQTPLPGPVTGVDPRTFALIAESLLDELVAPPAAPVRVRVQVQVDAPGQEVVVTTLRPAPGTVSADVAVTPDAAPADAPAVDATPAAPEPAPELPPVPDLSLPPPGGDPLADTGAQETEHPVVGFGADVVPFVGTSTLMHGREIRRLSLNLGGGLSHGVDGVGLAGGFQVAPGFVDGFVASGGFNYAGRVDGVLAAGGGNVASGRVEGAQVAGGLNVAVGGFRGAQVAGGLNHAYAASSGAQVAGGMNFAIGRLAGAQVAGGLNVAAGDVAGAQVAGGVNLAFGDVHGSQVAGGVNVATGEVDGLQLGVVNVSRKAGFALGLVNVFWGGRFHVEASADSAGFVHGRVKNGGDHFHYLYSVGGNPFGDDRVSAFGMGLGGHADLGERLFLDVEGIGHVLVGGDAAPERLIDTGVDPVTQRTGARGLYSARVVLGLRVLPKVALLGGLSYDLYVAPADHVDDGASYARLGDTLFSGGAPGEAIVRGWPSLTLGVQVF